MLTTVLFDMGGTLEDIWHNEGTKREALQCVWDTLRAISEINSGRHPGIQNLVRSGIPGKKAGGNLAGILFESI